MARELTTDEVRERFLEHIRSLVSYWGSPRINIADTSEMLSGLAFSILVLLDGSSSMPAFIVAPLPHPDDKQHHINEGNEEYYPENHLLEDQIKGDISGELHDLFYKKEQ